MSVGVLGGIRTINVKCNGEGCNERRYPVRRQTATQLRRYLRMMGWATRVDGGQDFCSACRLHYYDRAA